jgi:hypothetical protein
MPSAAFRKCIDTQFSSNPCLSVITYIIEKIHFITYLLTLLTELSPSWGATNRAGPQGLPSILWNPEVQYHIHKSPPLVLILSHINPIHSISYYLPKIHFNFVHPPTSWSSQWSLSFWLSHQYPIRIPLLPHSCCMSPTRSHPTYVRYILILSTHLRLGLPSGLFPSGFPTNIL